MGQFYLSANIHSAALNLFLFFVVHLLLASSIVLQLGAVGLLFLLWIEVSFVACYVINFRKLLPAFENKIHAWHAV